MILQAWLLQALIPSLLTFLVAWRLLGRSNGGRLNLGLNRFGLGVIATMTLVVLSRYALVFVVGGTNVVSPTGGWNHIIFVLLPAVSAAVVALIARKLAFSRVSDASVNHSNTLKPHQIAAIAMGLLITFISLLPVLFANRNDYLGNYMNSPIYLYPIVGVIAASIIVFIAFFADRQK